MRVFVGLIILLGMIASTGCQANSGESGAPLETPSSPVQVPQSTPSPASTDPGIVTPDRGRELGTKMPERISPTGVTTPVTGEVPSDLLDSIVKDLAARAGAAPQEISVVQAESVVWNDGSLGCPQPGVMYTQALVNGYQVVLAIGDQRYDYHAADTGYFTLCERVLRPISPPGTPNS